MDVLELPSREPIVRRTIFGPHGEVLSLVPAVAITQPQGAAAGDSWTRVELPGRPASRGRWAGARLAEWARPLTGALQNTAAPAIMLGAALLLTTPSNVATAQSSPRRHAAPRAVAGAPADDAAMAAATRADSRAEQALNRQSSAPPAPAPVVPPPVVVAVQGGVVSPQQAAQAAARAGFRGGQVSTMVAIMWAESSGDCSAVNVNYSRGRAVSTDHGCVQINDVAHPQVTLACAEELDCSMREAHALFLGRGGSFADWVTYSRGTYRRFLGMAQAASAGI